MKEASASSIYLDANATTALDPRVLDVMIEECRLSPANPSSIHTWGRYARARLSGARNKIASLLNVEERDLVFTSGATESLNTLIRGWAKGHVITSSIEHSAILEPCKDLEKQAIAVTYLPTDETGALKVEQIEQAIQPTTSLIIIGCANSETGILNPIEAIARLASSRNIPLILDAVGQFGRAPFNIPMGATAVVFSAHKIHGPVGIGLTWAKKPYPALISGGGQEMGRRSGSENLPAIIGFAKAVELLYEEGNTFLPKIAILRDKLENGLKTLYPPLLINGKGPRVCNTSNLCFPNMDGENLLIQLDRSGVGVSLGSACASGSVEPSHVLLGMGLPRSVARSSLRFSLSRMTTEEEIDDTLRIFNLLLPTISD